MHNVTMDDGLGIIDNEQFATINEEQCFHEQLTDELVNTLASAIFNDFYEDTTRVLHLAFSREYSFNIEQFSPLIVRTLPETSIVHRWLRGIGPKADFKINILYLGEKVHQQVASLVKDNNRGCIVYSSEWLESPYACIRLSHAIEPIDDDRPLKADRCPVL